MPEALTIDPLTAPAAGSSAPAGGGIDSMMAQLDAAHDSDGVVPPAPEPAPAKPPGDDAPQPEPAPEPAKPVDPAKPAPAAKPADGEMSVEDMEKFLKAHPNKKPWKIYESLKTTTAGKVAELEAKLKTLESKPNEAPGDAAKVAALEKQISALTGETTTYKQRLAESAFQHTPQFIAFRDRAGRVLAKGHQIIAGMKYTEGDGTERPATKEDFDFLRSLPAAKRGEVAKAALGDFNAFQIASLASQVDDIREESDAAAEEWAKTHESRQLQGEQMSKAEQAKFDTHLQASMDQIKKHPSYGKWFAPDEKDPEASELLAKGFAQVEEMVKGLGNATPDVAAAQSAVLRSRAAAFPRMMLEYNRQVSKVAALEAELAKFRATDPGARPSGGGAPAGERTKGIDEVAMSFDADPGLVNRR